MKTRKALLDEFWTHAVKTLPKKSEEVRRTLESVFNRKFDVKHEGDAESARIIIDRTWDVEIVPEERHHLFNRHKVDGFSPVFYVTRAESVCNYPHSPDDVDVIELGKCDTWIGVIHLLVKEIALSLLTWHVDREDTAALVRELAEEKKLVLNACKKCGKSRESKAKHGFCFECWCEEKEVTI